MFSEPGWGVCHLCRHDESDNFSIGFDRSIPGHHKSAILRRRGRGFSEIAEHGRDETFLRLVDSQVANAVGIDLSEAAPVGDNGAVDRVPITPNSAHSPEIARP